MIDRLVHALRHLLEGLAVVFLALVLITVFMQVVFRYVLQISMPFTEEAARYFGVWLVFMGGAAIVATEGHIRLTFLLERVGGLWREVLVGFSALLVLIFNGIILIGGVQLARLNWNQSATTLPVTVSVLYIAVAVGAACSIVFALHLLKSRLAGRS